MEEKAKRRNGSYTLDDGLKKQFGEHCAKNCINASRLIERLIKEYLEKNGKKR